MAAAVIMALHFPVFSLPVGLIGGFLFVLFCEGFILCGLFSVGSGSFLPRILY